MTRTEKLLAELIALPSVNPAFLPAHHPKAGEKSVADFLASVAARAGLEVEFQPVLPGRSNVIARLPPRGKIRRTLLLAPHLDTVNADDSQFVPRRKDGRLHGRGASDTKGSVAAMLTALCELAEAKSRPVETEIVFAGLIDEENAQAGSRALVGSARVPRAESGVAPDSSKKQTDLIEKPGEKSFRRDAENGTPEACAPPNGNFIPMKAALAIVGEPTRLQVVTAHKGSLWLKLETRGRAAHGSAPQLGQNAVHEMARIVDWLETDYAARLRRRRHPLLGSGTVSVGMISGGTQPNIVPDRCSITIDRRTLPGETETGVCREITALLRAKKLSAKISSTKLAPCLPLETNPKLPLVRQFLRSAGQRRPAGVDFFCDAAVLSAGSIPSVAFGPGDIAQAHTADEWISLDSLERGKNLLLNFLKSLS